MALPNLLAYKWTKTGACPSWLFGGDRKQITKHAGLLKAKYGNYFVKGPEGFTVCTARTIKVLVELYDVTVYPITKDVTHDL